jgi:hypothetical protein
MLRLFVSFDRAAGFYDQTRGFPEGVAGEVASLVVEPSLVEGDATRLPFCGFT